MLLFWPLLLGLLLLAWRSKRMLGVAVAVFAVASFAAGLEVSAVAQPPAFFSLPARAWGFAVGGLIVSSCPSSALPWSRWPGSEGFDS